MLSTGGTPMANFAALQFSNANGIPMMLAQPSVVIQGHNNQLMNQFAGVVSGGSGTPQQQMHQQNQLAAALAAQQAAAVARMGSGQPSPAQLQLLSIQQAATQRIQAQLAQQAQHAMSQANAMQQAQAVSQGQIMQMMQLQQQQQQQAATSAMMIPAPAAVNVNVGMDGGIAVIPDSEPAELIHTAAIPETAEPGLTPPNGRGIEALSSAPVAATS